MKLFAIITAGLMAAGGGVYFYSASTCSKSGCTGAPVAKSGGCCAEKLECCATHEECCPITEAAGAVATNLTAAVSAKASCCAVKDECCLVLAACCTAEQVNAAAKPIEIAGCCEACASPVRTVTSAAKSIASLK